jgi:hypothetical protein
VVRGNVPALDFFMRSGNVFRPIATQGIPASLPIVMRWRDPVASGAFVLDDYETGIPTTESSSGGSVSFDLSVSEGSTTWWESREATLEWSGSSQYYKLGIVSAERDLRDDAYLSFAIAQLRQEPTQDINFEIALIDEDGHVAAVNSAGYGAVDLYSFFFASDFRPAYKLYRLRLCDFTANGTGLDLSRVAAVRFRFGHAHGSPSTGRVTLDDVEIVRSPLP